MISFSLFRTPGSSFFGFPIDGRPKQKLTMNNSYGQRGLSEIEHNPEQPVRREIFLIRLTYVIAICVAVGLTAFAVVADRVRIEWAEKKLRDDVRDSLAKIRGRLESNVLANVQLVRGIPGLISLKPDFSQSDFEKAMAPIFGERSQVRNIAAAPDMVIRFMYPIQGNEKAIGLDYRTNPAQFEAADLARRERRLVLAGPVDLVQGGTAFISRIPVFLKDADGSERFWGLVSAVIEADQLFRESGLLNNNLPIEIGMRGKDGTGSHGECFFGPEDIWDQSPVLNEIELPYGSWQMAAIPKTGWTTSPRGLWTQRIMFLLTGGLIVIPLLILARTRNQLLETVIQRQKAEDERRELELQVLHKQKLESLGLLAGGVAHDFNNILTAMMGFIYLLENRLQADEESRELLKNVSDAAERASSLCNQLLAYSGKGQFVIESIDLSELIRETEALLRVSIPRTTQVILDLADDLPRIEADASQIRQVVMNLITNATEAIGEKPGKVRIQTGLSNLSPRDVAQNLVGNSCDVGEHVTIRVSDSGCGMTPETLNRMFDPFFTTKKTGRGLGMAAVLGVVRSHNGAILCDTHPGGGTSFTVAFPPTTRAQVLPLESKTGAELSIHQTILLVDDEPVIRTGVAKALKDRGFTVLTASDGEEGMRIFNSHRKEIGLCIIDMVMPKLDGKAMLREIRKTSPDARVILTSGYAKEAFVHQSQLKAPIAFLKKPFRIDQLMTLIAKMSSRNNLSLESTVA